MPTTNIDRFKLNIKILLIFILTVLIKFNVSGISYDAQVLLEFSIVFHPFSQKNSHGIEVPLCQKMKINEERVIRNSMQTSHTFVPQHYVIKRKNENEYDIGFNPYFYIKKDNKTFEKSVHHQKAIESISRCLAKLIKPKF